MPSLVGSEMCIRDRCTLYRDMRVRELLSKSVGGITLRHVKDALFDDFGTPWSVCRPPRPGLDGGMTASVAMVVMQPALGIMEVAPLPALNRAFTRDSLPVDRAAMRSAAE